MYTVDGFHCGFESAIAENLTLLDFAMGLAKLKIQDGDWDCIKVRKDGGYLLAVFTKDDVKVWPEPR